MLKRLCLTAAMVVLGTLTAAQGPAARPGAGTPPAGRKVALGDWPDARGPFRDGRSLEQGLIDKWALKGENFLWRAPYGGRSAPLVMGNRVYVQNPSGLGASLQERVMALDADTGKPVWEYKFNVFQSDVPPHRVGWASPAADPETGNIYAMGVGATVLALSKDGKLLWDRSIGEEFAAFTTHGGRTSSPIVDGNLVIVSAAISSWGTGASRQHRFVALDKRTGDIIWIASPGGRPYDTNYSAPVIATIDGTRLLISGSGDGGVYAMKAQTGEKVWSFMAAKRAVNTGVAVSGKTVIVSHGDENLDTPELGLIAAIDGSQKGEIKTTLWAHHGSQYGFSSPIADSGRVYQIDNVGQLKAFDLEKGTVLWTAAVGTAQKAPPVLADGKLYFGTEGGKVFIVRPHPDRAEILSEVELPPSTDENAGQSAGVPEPVFGGMAVSRGRIFFASTGAVYAIGSKAAKPQTGLAVDEPFAAGQGAPAWLQVSPTELVLKPGQAVKLHVKSFDAQGRLLKEETGATWTLTGLKGTVAADGTFTPDPGTAEQAGVIKATLGALSGDARARVVRQLPWTETFDAMEEKTVPPGWIIVGTARTAVGTIDGQKALVKQPDETIFKRYRAFVGPVDLANYTIEADVRGTSRRRQMPALGVTAQRYSLVIYGNDQVMKIESWGPETTRSAVAPFEWKPDTWIHLKLRVENMPDGRVRARGKAWPAGQPEPANWMIEKLDPIGNKKGAPGFFIDADYGAAIDNIKVTSNQ
ncbi:MAG TPA: PQQ-binding-like beta-propeller repeat protein [Vicinamibacterales bacterium]|nr:PQQ-binding-like beta-propeller repeat protein [Vicinamibacterales bacterium]